MKPAQSSSPGSRTWSFPGIIPSSPCLAVVLLLLGMALSTHSVQAQNFAPSEITLKGTTFNYDHSEWNGNTVDYYLTYGSGNPVVFISTPYSGVATVSHDADEYTVAFSGFWINGGYTDDHVDESVSGSVFMNNHEFGAVSRRIDYSLDGSGQLVPTTTTVYSSSDGTITVVIDANGNGTISGTDSGYVVNGSWYVNNTQYTSDDTRSINDVSYTRTMIVTNYTVSSGNVESSSVHTYAGNGGQSFTVSYGPSGPGVVSGSVNGFVIDGTWYVNTTSSLSSPSYYPPSPLLGKYYNFTSGTQTTVYNSDGSSTTSEQANFASGGATLTINSNGSGSVTLSGNDPDYGSFSGTYSTSSYSWTGTITRTASSFAGSVFYNTDVPVRFRSGTGDFSGNVTDTYSTDDNSLTVTISGDPTNNSTASVYVSGSYSTSGSFYNGSFNVSGYNFRSSPYTVTSTPHTGPSNGVQTYWVNGYQLNWTSGSDTTDSDGFTSNSSDDWGNSSTGNWMSISVTAPAPGEGSYTTINISVGGAYYSGRDQWSYGSFVWDNDEAPEISTTQPTPTGGPPAFAIASWDGMNFRGNYFDRGVPTSRIYNGNNSEKLRLDGSPGNFTVNFRRNNGSNPPDTYDFSFNGQAGLFTINPPSGGILFAFTASNYALQIPGNTPPSGYPPAIYVPGASSNYAFVGTGPDADIPTETAAYYVIPDLTWWGGGAEIRMLKIRLSDNAVSLSQPNQTSTLAEGYYDPSTHLFHLDPAKSGLPMPTYGVDPLNNNLPWQLPEPPAGFPATALVNGEYWRFVSVDGNGVLHYAGAYPSQTLTLTPSTSRSGVYDVALTTPYGYGNDTGEFHNFTFTMDNLNQVISGSQTGSTINPNNIPRHNIAGDIDIFGNVLSLGSLQNDPDMVGLTMSFADNLTTSSLTMALARPSSEWVWSHPGTLGSASLVPAMKLDASHRLKLYDPASTTTPAIVLDPTGKSDFKADVSVQGTLRVKARGDLSMGAFTNGPQP